MKMEMAHLTLVKESIECFKDSLWHALLDAELVPVSNALISSMKHLTEAKESLKYARKEQNDIDREDFLHEYGSQVVNAICDLENIKIILRHTNCDSNVKSMLLAHCAFQIKNLEELE